MSQKKGANKHEEMELRRGPWTLEEDSLLIHYIARHGEGRWNLLARCSGLKRTGKSCRLRWLNYLKPDVKRGNLSPEEQFLILELHSKWGNRWSRIAQYLPGRTDNEIKNYWRTRVQKQARQLKIDANSSMFRDAVRCYWMPRLLDKMASNDPSATQNNDQSSTMQATQTCTRATPGQPQYFNPFPQDYVDASSGGANCYEPSSSDTNYSMEYGHGAPCTYSTASTASVPIASYAHGMHNGYNLEGLGLASATVSQNMDYSPPQAAAAAAADCYLEGGGNWVEGLWSNMDEYLWHGWRPQE